AAFEEGQPLIVDQHHARKRADRRAIVDAMLDRHRGLGFGKQLRVRRFLQHQEIASGLADAGPVPGFARRDVILADVDQLVARSDLALRPVKNDLNSVLAVKELNVVKHIALAAARLGKAEELTVAVQLRLPSRRQVAFEMRAVEGRADGEWPIGDHRAAPAGDRAGEAAVETLDVAETEMGCLERPEQAAIGVRTKRTHAYGPRDSLGVGRDLRVVGQRRDLAGCIDRTLPVDTNAVTGTVSHAGADNEVERRRSPHPIGNADLWRALDIESRT